jgi:WD40 repeat protein
MPWRLLVAAILLAVATPRLPGDERLPPGAIARLGTPRFQRPFGVSTGSVFSADGKQLFLACGNEVVVLDASGQEVRHVRLDTTGSQGPQVSPDGPLMAVAEHEGQVSLLDMRTGRRLSQLGRGPGELSLLLFSGDGKWLLTGNREEPAGTILTLWDTATGKRARSVTPLHKDLAGAALSGDATLLATWGARWDLLFVGAGDKVKQEARIVQVWDLSTGKEKRRIALEDGMPTAAAFSPDRQHLAVTSSAPGLTIYEVATGNAVLRWATPRFSYNVRYSPDGKRLAVCGGNGGVYVWDVATGRRLCWGVGPKGTVVNFAFRPDGKVAACTVCSDNFTVWEMPSAEQRTGHTTGVSALAFHRDGKTLVSVGEDGIRWWDLAGRQEVLHKELREDGPEQRRLQVLDLAADGRRVIAPAFYGLGFRVLDLDTERELLAVRTDQIPRQGCFAVLSADSRTVATLRDSGKVSLALLGVDSGKTKHHVELNTKDSTPLALATDGQRVAFLRAWHDPGRSAELTVWDITSGEEVKVHRKENARSVVLSPDGRLAALVGDRQPVTVHDLQSGTPWPRLEQQVDAISGPLAFSPDGRLLAAAVRDQQHDLGGVVVWELASSQVRVDFTGHRGAIFDLAFSPDSRVLATGGADTTILLWDLHGPGAATGKPQEKDLERLWTDLAGDALTARRAMARLAACSEEAIVLVRKRLPPAPGRPPDRRRLLGWINELDADRFEVRERAMAELRQAGRAAEPALAEALQGRPAPERKQRLEALLAGLQRATLPRDMLRPVRALELLERLGTTEARKLVEELAGGNEGAELTSQARIVLRRMSPAAPGR